MKNCDIIFRQLTDDVEDIEDEESIRGIYDIWEFCGFGGDYPGIEASLVQHKETGVSSAKAGRLKEELRILPHGVEAEVI